ncbi:MAG TPA: YibE/F family protein [bacterium]|nr:YibE/F family protein [bacterium]HNS33813.1 YibE/F family protein [bacterium]HNZ73356.1 YibE/F family protein [bacterium]HOH66984.1 YibE/F family protein [bacterium]
MVKKVLLIILLLFVLTPIGYLSAQEGGTVGEVFEARVIDILEERTLTSDQAVKIQQNLKLEGLTGAFTDRQFEYYGIGDIEVIGSGSYKIGDRVLVNYTKDADGSEIFFVLEKVRRNDIYLLFGLFVVVVLIVGRSKGLRALLALVMSFLVILKFIVPRVLAGSNPLIIALIGSFFILLLLIYLTEGFNRKSHLAVLSIFLCLILVFLLADFFVGLLSLSGTVQEETAFLVSAGYGHINFQGLLLAAFLIGALGILDDVVVGQIEAVGQIKQANPSLPAKKLFKMAMAVGNAHLGSVINTLFLAYAGASFSLLLLFSIKQPPFLSLTQVISSELVATEIVRTLVGCIGLALAIPLATIMAVWFYTPRPLKENNRENQI